MEYAIDKERNLQRARVGFYKPLYQIAVTGSPDYNPACTPRKYDPAKAKQLLTEAGYPQGFKFEAYFPTSYWKDGVTIVQNNLAQMGLQWG